MVQPKITNRLHGRNFGQSPHEYDQFRPGYPDEALDFCVNATPGPRVVDVGAGTGKLSTGLRDRGLDVVAIDPDTSALELNPCHSLVGTGENIPVPNASADMVTFAQSWHWVDPDLATQECARVLAPGGVVAILINQLDVSHDWVMRIARIIHAGDVYREEWRPKLSDAFGDVEAHVCTFTQEVTFDDVVGLASTRSYWLRSGQQQRDRIVSNLRDYLFRENPMGEKLQLPYVCLTYVARLNA
ncbi:class I SAM-dependent methyltransferase [Brevibacterium sp. UMB1308A]|uniref:class I SAM-dependent methyltransferase n=1 Tax=Brevibacterium sp. UMB1308A TaxID=3050608 RepID=UPI00254F44E9|nr:class I SAM-dependent methyltransferase [Brevibacterium sp. UMB1308A]MDK8345385.1 class I SAM-dependent methyltransferase [Brevibacterium sp. UMB1308B]MDK8713784.1 class I SAM-dependent methyltransferase [Brevibacterium sp. UMB1308A]